MTKKKVLRILIIIAALALVVMLIDLYGVKAAIPVLLTAMVFVWRMSETVRAVTLRSIIIPPLGMSTGLGMLAFEPMRIPIPWAVTAFSIGAVILSYPVIKTTRLIPKNEVIFMERSKTFIWIFIGLAAARLAARRYIEQYVSYAQTASLFFLLAYGMVVIWRLWMLEEYYKITAAHYKALASQLMKN